MKKIKIVKEVPFLSITEIGRIWDVDDRGYVHYFHRDLNGNTIELAEYAQLLVDLGLATWIKDNPFTNIVKFKRTGKNKIELTWDNSGMVETIFNEQTVGVRNFVDKMIDAAKKYTEE